METGWKRNGVEISPNCPRCGSCNTKFCYYNNYSLTQPRYFCKACRRYWTKGGSLRNVPVGGGCRKTRRGNCKPSFAQPSPNINLTDADNYDPTRNSPSTISSDAPAPPNIDLALVYANFLSQKPPDNDGCVEYNYSSGPGPSAVTVGTTPGCLTHSQSHSSQLSSEGNQMHFYGFSSVQKDGEGGIENYCCSSSSIDVHTMNFELPPLPGEEAAAAAAGLHDNDMMWSSDSALHATQPTHFGADDALPHDADLLLSDWRHFHFPRP